MFELSLDSQQSGLISTPPYNNQGLSDYQDPLSAVNPANSSQLPVPFIDTVFQAINETKYILSGLSSNSQKDYIMGTAFGQDYNQDSANQILTAWAQNNFTGTPHIKLVSAQNFNGAFAKDNDTIYLSGEFVAANKDNVGAVTGVLVEEVGHSLDSQINVKDAAGDEGDIFSRLVRGQSISAGELVSLKGEDDHGVLVVDGLSVGIEKNDTLSTAENIGTLGYACYAKSGWVGGSVPNDYYRFQINNPSKIILDLVNLQSDVDLKLLDSNGNMIYSSAKGGTANEQISAQIGSGTYYIHVQAFSGSSNYNLGITAMQGRMNPDTDVDGDGKADIVGFGPDNVVHTSFSNGDGTFRQSIGSTPGFTKNYGWTNFNEFPRMVADVNGDGKADIVGFYSDKIFVSIGNGDGTFKAATSTTPGFTKNYGWTNFNDFPRMLADVNGDGKADIIGFGPDNVVHTSLSNGDGTFRQSIGSTPGFTKNYGWTNFNEFPRMVADVNGDGKADIVGFYSDKIFVSIGNGDGTFKAATSTTPGFTKNYGWNTFNDSPRMLADVNGDGKADIVGFDSDRIFISIGNGNGTFQTATATSPGFTKNYGWNTFNDSPRMLADVNGDGKADIVGFDSDRIFVSIGNGNSTFKTATATTPGFTKNYGWTNFNEFPRMVGNQSLGGFASPSGLMTTSANLTKLINGDLSLIGQYIDVDKTGYETGKNGAFTLYQCWDFVAYAAGMINTSYSSNPYWSTSNWKRGENVIENGNVAVGTAIATFKGTNNLYGGHTAIFAGYGSNNGVSGFYVWDQNWDGSAIQKHFISINGSSKLNSNAKEYFVVKV